MTSRLMTAFQVLSAVWRVLRKSRFRVTLPMAVRPEQACVILGNGPSLSDDLREHMNELAELDLYCVGRFAESDEYAKLRPKHYVFADPMWWATDAPAVTKKLREDLFSAIAGKTCWPMHILAPVQAETAIRSMFQASPFITPVFFNLTPVTSDLRIAKYIYDHNLGMPPVQNVLVACIFLALRMGHKNIVVLGADHSWHETVALNERNQVCLQDRHFYDKDVSMKPFTMDGSPGKIFTMDRLFLALGRMFEGYWSLARYAQTVDATIQNASSITYIDAFPRTSLADALYLPAQK